MTCHTLEDKVKDWRRHVPFALIVFVVVYLGAADLAVGVGISVLVTLLAPVLWLGLYLLGSNHAADER